MSCTTLDLQGFFLGELPEAERRQAEEHLKACPGCREELERLRLTRTALLALEDEPIPQRIAFVSDRVFEPRWWHVLWQHGPQWAMISAGMLSAAILVHALVHRPAPPGADAVTLEARVQAEVARRLPAVIEQAVAASEQRQQARLRETVAAVEKKTDFQRQADLVAMQESLEYMRKRMGVMYQLASNDLGGVR
jgi:anti-sigma factor RsiW